MINNNYNAEQLRENIEAVLLLEYLGVHIEDTKEEVDRWSLSSVTGYYYSVPEFSTIETEDEEFNNKIKTADGLKHLAKETLAEMIINSCKREFGDDSSFIDDVKNNFSDYFKFYAKVRVGEVWNKEFGINRIKELTDAVRKAGGYNEV